MLFSEKKENQFSRLKRKETFIYFVPKYVDTCKNDRVSAKD